MSLNFSPKQLEYWKNATHRWNIKTGATGSGKTFLDFYMLPKRIRACTGAGLIVLIGNTRGTLSRNILDPLRNIYGDKLVGTISSDNTANLFGKKVYCLGADKINQVAKIQGATIEYAYGDEVTTWAQEVFEMLKSRLRCPNSCFDGTCNPADPDHWFKKFLESDADIFLQEYEIFDNPFLPKGFIDELCKEYAGTVYYDRFILGKWARAEGLVFRKFAEKTEDYLCDDTDIFEMRDGEIALDRKGRPILLRQFSKLVMGIDFGGSGSQTTFVLWGYLNGYDEFRTLEEEGMPLTADIDAQDICDAWLKFRNYCVKKYGRIDWIFPDSASPTMINSLRSTARQAGIGEPSSSPIAPSLTRTDSVWEIGLANLYRRAGSTTITNSDITDTRPDSSRCGYITVIHRLDTEGLMQQFYAFYQEFVDNANATLEEFKQIGTDAYNKLSNYLIELTGQAQEMHGTYQDDLRDFYSDIVSQGQQKYDSFDSEITAYIEELQDRGETSLAAITQQMLNFRNTHESEFLAWLLRMQDKLKEYPPGEFQIELDQLKAQQEDMMEMLMTGMVYTKLLTDDSNYIVDDKGKPILIGNPICTCNKS